jgi:hypothetical protein
LLWEGVFFLKESVIDFINKKGVKKSFVAEQIGLTPSQFSLWLHGRFTLNQSVEEKLENYIKDNS